jgi:membrane protease YdiL (CAAX protease family)
MRTILRPYLREIIIAVASAAVLVLMAWGVLEPLHKGKLIFFAEFTSFFRAIGLNLALILVFMALPRARDHRHIFLLFQVFFLGYLGSEVAYRLYHPKLGLIYPDSPWLLALYHGDYFLLHRAYQVIPLALTLLFFLSYPKGFFENHLRFGDWGVRTQVARGRTRSWRGLALFFIFTLFIVLAAITALSSIVPGLALPVRDPGWGPARWALLVPITSYSLVTALFEEIFFRGLFFAILTRSFGDRGNLYQAIVFGAIHFDILNPALSLVKLVIFAFLGWLWGNAVRQTGGIGCGFLMHSAILFTLNVRVYFLS